MSCSDPAAMLSAVPTEPSDRKLRLLACAACRRVWDVLDGRGRDAAAAAERYAGGLMDPEAFDDVVNDMGEAVGEFASNYARLFGGPVERAGDAAMQAAAATTAAPMSRSDAGDALGPAAAASRSPGEPAAQAVLRGLFGNPFRSVAFDPSWLTPTVFALAEGIYQERAFDRMPILADALQDAGCDGDEILSHCRQPGEHVRGCWVVDLVLGKE